MALMWHTISLLVCQILFVTVCLVCQTQSLIATAIYSIDVAYRSLLVCQTQTRITAAALVWHTVSYLVCQTQTLLTTTALMWHTASFLVCQTYILIATAALM